MAGIVLPQVLVFQQFRALPSELTEPLRAFIFGPEYNLHRYTVASEKQLAGSYDSAMGNTFSWLDDLGRRTGAKPDLNYTKVYLENALLKYWDSVAGAQTSSSNYSPGGGEPLIRTPLNVKNKIHFSTVNLVGKEGYALDADLYDRDVRLGDYAELSIVLDGVTYSGGGKIIGFEADAIAAVVGTAAPATNNQATNLAAAPAVTLVGTTPYSISVSGTYDGIADGVVNETYTITAVRGTTGLDPSTGVFNIVSASGKDTVLGYKPTATSFFTFMPLGGNGLTFRFSPYTTHEVSAGDSWVVTVSQSFTKPVATSGGTYSGPSDTTYVITVIRGGNKTGGTDAEKPLVLITTSTGVDSEPAKVVGNSALDVGNYGVTVTFDQTRLLAGDQYWIPVTAEGEGPIRTIVIDKSLPSQLVTTSESYVRGLSATLNIKKNFELPNQLFDLNLVNWNQTSDEVVIEAGAMDYDSSWRSGEVAIPVTAGDLYIHWRELITDHGNAVYSIGTLGDLTDEFDTPVDPDNPLVYAASKALSNSGTSSAPSTGIRLMAVKSDDIDGYTYVLDTAEGRDDLYTFVPLTFDRSIQNLVVAHVQSQSTPEIGLWRIALVCSEELDPMPVVTANDDDSVILATTTSDRYLDLDESSTVQLLTDDVRAGDIARLNYGTDLYGESTWTEYTIDSVQSENRLRLVTAPNPIIGTPSKVEIWRSPEANDIVDQVGQKAAGFGSRRVYNIYPSSVKSGGVYVAGYFLCAAIAGLIGASVPQQGLTNVQIVGFDDMRNVIDRFNRSQLDTLANYGVWIVTQDLRDGSIYTRQQLSTDTTDLNTRELSVVKNLDSISYYFQNILKPYIGRANVTPTAIEVIRTQIDGGISALSTIGFNPVLGGQVLDGTKIAELRQHTILKDRLVVVLNIVQPYPLNNIELYLVV